MAGSRCSKCLSHHLFVNVDDGLRKSEIVSGSCKQRPTLSDVCDLFLCGTLLGLGVRNVVRPHCYCSARTRCCCNVRTVQLNVAARGIRAGRGARRGPFP